MRDSKPLVWLPFDPQELPGRPDDLRYEHIQPRADTELPASVAEVELYVPPYQFSNRDSVVLSRMSSLKVVQTMSAGVDHLLPAIPPGVTLCRGAGVHDASTAELTVALILASLRRIPDFVEAQQAGEWRPGWGTSLADRTVLIVGYGSVGAAVERRLAGFEAEVLRVARSPREGVSGFAELPDLLPRADVVVLIVPSTDETRGMVDADFLAAMRDGALLVNMARGPVVETDALVDALGSGRVRAALDVTDPEPLPAGHPLWQAPNVLITPHVGGASSAMWPRAHALVAAQLRRYAAGEPLQHVVTGAY